MDRLADLLARLSPLSRRRVIYTCLFGYSEPFGDYPVIRDGRTDYICFTDDPELKSKRWQIRLLDSSKIGPVRTAKQIKILAHRFLPNYRESLYVDNRVKLKAPPSFIFQSLQQGSSDMMCFRHPERNCIYAEALEIIKVRYDDPDVVHKQMAAYRDDGYPEDSGLILGTVLLRRHNTQESINLMEAWFSEVMKHSYRDQMSFNYAAYKQGFKPSYLPGSPYSNDIMEWVIPAVRVPRDFRDDEYLALHKDVRDNGINPRKHYLQYGHSEGRPYRL